MIRVQRCLFVVALAAIGATPGAGLAAAQEADYDIIIRGGRVIDGTGNPWFRADIGIWGDRILEIGDLSGVDATTVVDASGLYVVPGFIDVHSHAEAGLRSVDRSDAKTLLMQGLTTVVVNPDGRSPDIVAQRYAGPYPDLGQVHRTGGPGTRRRHPLGHRPGDDLRLLHVHRVGHVGEPGILRAG